MLPIKIIYVKTDPDSLFVEISDLLTFQKVKNFWIKLEIDFQNMGDFAS